MHFTVISMNNFNIINNFKKLCIYQFFMTNYKQTILTQKFDFSFQLT